jgi:hypothetical protein
LGISLQANLLRTEAWLLVKLSMQLETEQIAQGQLCFDKTTLNLWLTHFSRFFVAACPGIYRAHIAA